MKGDRTQEYWFILEGDVSVDGATRWSATPDDQADARRQHPRRAASRNTIAGKAWWIHSSLPLDSASGH
jgi:hypothetical protein